MKESPICSGVGWNWGALAGVLEGAPGIWDMRERHSAPSTTAASHSRRWRLRTESDIIPSFTAEEDPDGRTLRDYRIPWIKPPNWLYALPMKRSGIKGV